MAYRVEVERRAQKALDRLPKRDRSRVVTAIDALGEYPRPAGCVAVQAAPRGTYRIRVGDYRVVYVVLDNEKVIIVARVARRTETTYREPG
jgi:mRNA interferase RelE/StbE